MEQVKGICKVILFTFVPGVIVGLLAFVISYFLPVIVVELGRDFYLGDRILGAQEARDAGRQLFGFTGLCVGGIFGFLFVTTSMLGSWFKGLKASQSNN